jgi:hypothetical protein
MRARCWPPATALGFWKAIHEVFPETKEQVTIKPRDTPINRS